MKLANEKHAISHKSYPSGKSWFRSYWLTIKPNEKTNFIHLFFLALAKFSVAKQFYIDSLLKEANKIHNDTSKLIRLRTVARIYSEISPDSSFHYAQQSLSLARKLHFKLDEGGALLEMSYAYLNMGNYPRALQTAFSAMAIFENPQSEQNVLEGKFEGDDDLMYRQATPHAQRLNELAFVHQVLGVLYANSNNLSG